jgi:hypothetical protein
MSGFPNLQHLDLLRQGQRSLHEAIPLIDAAEACGLDCQEYRQGLAALSGRIDTYIGRFFPDQLAGGSRTGLPGHDG